MTAGIFNNIQIYTFDVWQETKIQHALPFLKAHYLLPRNGTIHISAAPTPLFWVRFTVLVRFTFWGYGLGLLIVPLILVYLGITLPEDSLR